MGVLKRLSDQLASLFGDRLPAGDLDREFQFHVEMETAALVAAGVPAEDARRRALAAFGGTERYKEEMRDGWVRRSVAELGSDIRYALRGLRRTPVFSIAAVSTLAIGLGGAAAVFTVVDAVLLAPLPYANEDRIVRIFQRNSETNRWSVSVADFQGMEDWQRSFSALVAVRAGEVALGGGPEPVWIRAGQATGSLFTTFGLSVAQGRSFQSSDEASDAPPVVVISNQLARERFGSEEAVGRVLVLDRVSHTVIGVLPPGVGSIGGIRADVWPLTRMETPTRRGPFGLAVYARLAPGVTHASASADLAQVSARLFPIYAASFSDRTATLTPYPLREVLLGDASKSLRVLGAGVLLVLLIALANVTNLTLIRAAGRERELALRTALGAGRRRLARLLLTEHIVLALLGGSLALTVAFALLAALRAVGPAMPRLETASLDAGTIAFMLLLSIGCGIAIALRPLSFGTSALADALRGGDRRSSAGTRARLLQNGLVIAEFALALPLLVGAALLLHSFMSLQRVQTGIDPTNALTIRVSLPPTQYPEPPDRENFWTDALRNVSTAIGVTAAGITSSLPPDNGGDVNNFDLVDRPVPTGTAEPVAPWSSVTPGYFAALRIPLLAGRMFDSRDDADAPPVLLVSRAWAEHYFPGESPLGRQLVSGGCLECPRSTVIGVVGDIKYSGLAGNGEGVYTPYAQWPRPSMFLVLRTAGAPAAAMNAVRAGVHAVDPHLPLVDAQLMEDRLGGAVAAPRHWTLLVGGFAVTALFLAALGVFGVMSYVVAQQQREIGVRLALGAAPGSVVMLILRRGLTLAAVGALIGLVLGMQGTRVLEHVLYDVSATDLRTFAATTLILLGVGALACYLPGRRAASLDPVRVIAAD